MKEHITPHQARARLGWAVAHDADPGRILALRRDLDFANIAASIERRTGGAFTQSQRSTLYQLIRNQNEPGAAEAPGSGH
jgi:hypothetical protein